MKLFIALCATSFLCASAQRNVRVRKNQQQGGNGAGNGNGAGVGNGMGNGGGQHNYGTGNRMGGNLFVDVTPVALTQAETDELRYMVQEEKMARDVYDKFFQQYQIRIFENIRNSEQHHGDLVRQALQLHGLTDPNTGKDVGQFENAALAQVYNELVTSGLTSLGAALRAGAKIEETDINDLNDALQDTAVPYLDQMYERLRRASENHLRAFVRTLESIGEGPYSPTVLTTEEFNAIINYNQ